MAQPRWSIPNIGIRARATKHSPRVEVRCREVRNTAMAHVRSVPYRVTLRWVFYRLLQDGLFRNKRGYKELEMRLSEARHQQIDGWAPDTLADEGRDLSLLGGGFQTDEAWLVRATNITISGQPDYWKHQPCYLIVAFEAAAMQGQFDFHLPPFVSRCAFKGEDSIEHKDKLRQAIEDAADRYEKPIVVLYFGDDDKKGWQIPQIVERDIRLWTSTPFEWVRAGLIEGQGAALGIPENPASPGTYQWEALDDDQAGEIIAGAVGKHLSEEGEMDAELEGRRREAAWADWWGKNKPTREDLGL